MNFKNFIHRTLSVVALACLSSAASYAQVTTNGASGLAATYPDLDAAITALNGATITAPVVITLTAANPQTAPAGGYVITAEGTAANTITINGSSNIVTASAAHTVGNINDAVFKLVGADYVTLQGFTMQENAANTIIATAATNNATEWGVALLYATTTNGAQNNTIQNNTISLDRAYRNSFGIYSNSTHSATNATTTATATSNNTGLRIYSNNISNVNLGIAVVGPTAAANFQTVDIQGNSITNYATNAQLSAYANLSGTNYGILLRNVTDYNVSNNTIASSNGGYIVTIAMKGILVTSAINTPTGTFTQTINANNISLRPGASASINSIEVNTATSTATSSLSINNNDFNTTGHTVAATAAVVFISNLMAVLTTNINNNTFTNLSLGTTGNVTFITNSVTRPVNAVCNVNNNSIVTGFNKTGAGGIVNFYTSGASSLATVTETNMGNNFSNITVTGATTISGWRNTDGGSPTKNVSNNTFSNIVGGTSSITGLAVAYSGSAMVSNNTVSNISSAGSITGIESISGTQNIDNNNIFNLSTTGNSLVIGIYISGGTTQNVRKNKVTNLESTGATGSVFGISATGTLTTISNNIIGDLRTPASSAANPLIGINISGGTAINVFHNTVYLAGTSTGTNFGSSAISASSTPTLTMNSNIFVNASIANGTGLAVAYRRSTATLTSYQASSNRNAFFGSTIYTDGTTPQATFAGYQAAMATRDALSINENPPFLSLVSANANYLHINTTIATGVESGGDAVGGITDDFDGDIRFGNAGYTGTGFGVDMGADEFNGITNIAACTGAPTAANTVASVTSICAGTVFNLNLSTNYVATGITFQWQSSTNGVTYSNIIGATAATTTASQSSAMFYRAIVSCTNSGQSITATPVSVTQNTRFFCYCVPTYATGGASDAIVNVTLNTLNNTSAGSVSPYYVFYNTVTIPTITNNATETISVRINSDINEYVGVWIDYNQDGDFYDADEFVAFTTTSVGTSLTAVLTFTVPTGALTGQTLMRVRSKYNSALTNDACVSATFGETEDYIVNIVAAVACTGVPASSNTLSSVASACTNAVFNLSLSTAYTAGGITYQWQSSADGVTYANMAGATSANTTASQAAATFYRAIVTCANSGSSITSTPVSVALNTLFNCYCTPTYASGPLGDEITNVTLNTLNNTSAASALPYYTFFNTVTVPSITKNATETVSVTLGSSSGDYIGVWIDYNQDGDFNDAGEFVANTIIGSTASGTSGLTFTVPSSATAGQTMMRVRSQYSSIFTNTPCGASLNAYGEAEDYIVNIVAATACALTASISTQTNVSCFGGTGVATIAAANGTAPYAYLWTGGNTNPTRTNLTAGTYIITVTDAAACSVTTAVTITQPASALTANASTTTNVSCFGGNNAAAMVTANGGTAPYSFAWSNGRTTANNTGLIAGTYNVTVTDNKGCMAMSSATISQPTAITVSTASTQASCGSANGTATATVSGGTAPYSYLWTGGRTGANVTALTAGVYNLTLTDNAGCTAFSTTTVSQPSSVSVSASSTNIACNGATTGTATATANGGTAPYSFSWSNGRTTANNIGLTANIYNVTVTDNVGCSAFTAVTITQPTTALSLNTSAQTNVACFGGTGVATIAAAGGTAPYAYLWTGGNINATRTNLTAGTYMATTTDANGCMAMTSLTITQPAAALSLSISAQTNVACFGGTGVATIAAAGGTAPYAYLWTGGNTNATRTNLTAGTYMATTTDANGCMAMTSLTITQPAAALSLSTSAQTNVACFGGTGVATIAATGGTTPYAYLWTGGNINATRTNLTAGTYTTTVTDANGCMATTSLTITQPATALSLNIAVDNNVSCFGLTDGMITANPSGGTTTYSFAWSNGQTNAVATGLTAGSYTTTITDANGCTAIGSSAITAPSALSISVASTNPTSCGSGNGSVIATVSGGTTAYSFTWNNGGNTAALNSLNTGLYTVTTTDANGCMITASATLSTPNGITVTFPAFTNVTCFGADDATINTAVAGGSAPFAFAWNNNATTQNVSGLAAGTYFVSVTDANGCNTSASLSVGAPAQLTVAATATDASCLTCADGMAMASTTGGTGAISFMWNDGQTTATATGLLPDTYTVRVTDANGCNTTTNVIVSGFVAVTEQTANAIRLFPNPTTGFVTIDGLNAGARLSVVNSLGQVIRSVETQNNVEQIDLSDLAPAVYLIRIESGRQQTTLRVTVAK